MKYKPEIVKAYFKAQGIPEPTFEYKFHPVRRWRADLCWIPQKLILEVQGGIFIQGRHSRGAAMLKEWEKLNTACGMGYRFLFCQPKDLMGAETVEQIKTALKYGI